MTPEEDYREFQRQVFRDFDRLCKFIMVMIVISPPLMIACAYLAADQENAPVVKIEVERE